MLTMVLRMRWIIYITLCCMSGIWLAELHGNRSKTGYGSINSRWYGEHVQNPGFAAEWWNNIWDAMFFVVFGFCMGLVMNLNWIGCFRKTLAACFAFASEFGRFWCAFVFLDVCDHIFVSLVFQQPMGSFSKKLCVLHFSEAACLYDNFGQNGCFWNLSELCDEFEVEKVNSTHVQLKWNGREFIFAFPLPLPRRQKRRNTVHVAWQTDTLLCFVFLCGKELSACAVTAVVLGSVLVQTLDVVRPTQQRVRKRLVVAIRSCWIFAQKRQSRPN